MLGGQSHKLCIREKRHQARYEPQSHKGVQPTAVMEELPSTSSLLEDKSQSSSATGSNSTSQGCLEPHQLPALFQLLLTQHLMKKIAVKMRKIHVPHLLPKTPIVIL